MSRADSALLLKAALQLGEARPDRAVPSPSSVTRCTRENWFKARGYEKTHEPDNGESVISAESGRLTEPLLLAVTCLAYDASPMYQQDDESGRELDEEELARVSMAGGQVDNILTIHGDNGVPAGVLGENVLVEFKRKGVFPYLKLLRADVREGAESDYVQMQSLMHAKQLPYALYVAANFSRDALTANTRKWDERPPGIIGEWVLYNEAEALAAKQRAETQLHYIHTVDDPASVPTDYQGARLEPGAGKFPCSWCRYWVTCKGVA